MTYRRARAVLLSAQGQTAPQIAHALGCSDRQIRNMLQAFNHRGVDSLPRRYAPGVPALCTPAQATAIVELFHHAPMEYGIERGTWTQADLCAVAVRQGIVPTIGRTTLGKILKAAGYRWQRAKRRSTSPDPAYEKKTPGSLGRPRSG
ncbi:MAG TPA: helix-turn-helix domain-containing protein [Armatimonadota bacterium]